MKTTCLVTGGAGFIGCALSSGLCDRFDEVVIVDKMHPQIHASTDRPSALDARATFLHADITDQGVMNELVGRLRPHTVIHLAAETGTGQSLTEATRHAQENVVGTTVMLDALAAHQHVPEQFILSSSRAVYGEGKWAKADGTEFYPGQRTQGQLAEHRWDHAGAQHVPFSARVTHPRPTSVYGATKLTQELILESWVAAFGGRLTILRLQNVYGPGQSLINSYTGIVSLFAQVARRGDSIPLYEDGEMLRDFVFIDDVASGFLAAIDQMPADTQYFDIGSGDAAPLSRVAQFMQQHYEAPAPHVNAKYRYGDVRHASCDMSDTLSRLNWSPQWPLEKGLAALCVWIETQL
ncbi:MAG: NAD(P)-dependent oxidoreductase [Pseudomonadota bacterium]